MEKSIVDIKQSKTVFEVNTSLINSLSKVLELPKNIISLTIKIEADRKPVIEAKFIGREVDAIDEFCRIG